MRVGVVFTWFAMCVSMTACDGSNSTKATTSDAANTSEPLPSVTSTRVPAGTIRGSFEMTGAVPPRASMSTQGSAGCGESSVLSESLIVTDGRLANVFVRVVKGLQPAVWPVPETQVTLDQSGCVYRPHVLAMRVGQTLRVRNIDPAVHNVHAISNLNGQANFNRSHAPGAADIEIEFTKPEVSIPFRCDLHPWMSAWVHVVDHPYFDLTGTDGVFEIAGLAPGSYELEYVHEVLGRHRFAVVLEPDVGVEFVIAVKAK